MSYNNASETNIKISICQQQPTQQLRLQCLEKLQSTNNELNNQVVTGGLALIAIIVLVGILITWWGNK